MHRYVSPADKLARQILKAATTAPPGQPLTLSIAKGWFAEEPADTIGAAIACGVEQGWLTERGDAWVLTADGEEIGRRSRAGILKKRRRL